MIELFRAKLLLYFRSPILYIAYALAILTGFSLGYSSYNNYKLSPIYVSLDPDAIPILTAILVVMLLIILCSGKTFSDGTIRNQIIIGHTKPRILLAEVMSASVIACIAYILFIITTAIGGSYFFKVLPLWTAIKWFALVLLIFECAAVISVVISYLTAKRALDLVVLIALLFVFYTVGSFTHGYYKNLDEPKEKIDILYIEHWDGTTEERAELRKNPYYTEGFVRVLIKLEHAVNPLWPLSEILDFDYMTQDSAYDSMTENNEAHERELDFNLIKMLIECAVFSAAGAFLFRYKELK